MSVTLATATNFTRSTTGSGARPRGSDQAKYQRSDLSVAAYHAATSLLSRLSCVLIVVKALRDYGSLLTDHAGPTDIRAYVNR
jgi:hypothetical protein